MEKRSRFVGLDVHAETIAVAVAEPDGEVRSLGIIPNRLESVRKLFKKLGPSERLRVCYEAGPTGYRLYWQLAAIGVRVMEGLLFGVSRHDPGTFALVPLIVVGVGLVATWIPAWRATRVEPIETLRAE